MQTIADAHNALKAQIGAGSAFHLDKSERTVTAADAADLATSLVLANDIKAIYEFHLADTLAHKAADAAPALTKATDLASAETLANAIKADYNTHRASTTYHYNADATNAVASADATDQASLNTLLNEMKGDLNAHLASGPSAASLRAVDG
ncbi:MAG TPA: hypothetical protein VFS15_25845 [Kofleriaceae bacterium]|nr:hypothetical protein [Kofleriaceae bacterium]